MGPRYTIMESICIIYADVGYNEIILDCLLWVTNITVSTTLIFVVNCGGFLLVHGGFLWWFCGALW